MERRSLFVAGSWTNPVGDQRSEVRSPYDGHLVGTIPCASMTGADAALSAARTSLGGDRAAMIVAIEPRSPFGGFKQSGIGRGMGRVGVDSCLETRRVVRPGA
jgi:betaine-aldehyde dehydrogenase